MQETWARSLGQEDPLEKGMAAHSSILAWRIPWTEEPGRLQSMSSQKRQIWLSNNNIKVHINSKCERQVLNVNLHESQMHFSSTFLFSTSLIWQTQKKKIGKTQKADLITSKYMLRGTQFKVQSLQVISENIKGGWQIAGDRAETSLSDKHSLRPCLLRKGPFLPEISGPRLTENPLVIEGQGIGVEQESSLKYAQSLLFLLAKICPKEVYLYLIKMDVTRA